MNLSSSLHSTLVIGRRLRDLGDDLDRASFFWNLLVREVAAQHRVSIESLWRRYVGQRTVRRNQAARRAARGGA
jgi:hypothetical protein